MVEQIFRINFDHPFYSVNFRSIKLIGTFLMIFENKSSTYYLLIIKIINLNYKSQLNSFFLQRLLGTRNYINILFF